MAFRSIVFVSVAYDACDSTEGVNVTLIIWKSVKLRFLFFYFGKLDDFSNALTEVVSVTF